MNALLILLLSGAACILISVHRRRWRPTIRTRIRAGVPAAARRSKPVAEAQPRLVRQLASLLSAGRTGPMMWQAMANVLAMELDRAQGAVQRASRSSPGKRRRPPEPGRQPAGAGTAMLRGAADVDSTLVLVLSMQRASALGLPTAAAIRTACREAPTRTAGAGSRRGALTAEQRRMWLDVAACFDVCEASGAPVAAVLERLAATLEADHDAAAQRETALAGPRATVRLLSWLPLVGLGLGILMGVDPLGALFGSPVGWTVLAAGAGFAVAGRFWSAKMIADAANPAPQRVGRRR